MNITAEQDEINLEDVEVKDMIMSYERYETMMQRLAECDRTSAQVRDFKNSVFYTMYKWFN